MFTGIITHLGTVRAVESLAHGKRLEIQSLLEMASVPIGASIACDGACMTVVAKNTDSFTVEISPESLAKTTLGKWQVGSGINLERPVAVGGEFGGHFVTGHVDAVAKITTFEAQGDFWLLAFAYPQNFGAYLADKGSVAINGVSLTVNKVQRESKICELMIIPHTLDHTNLGNLKVGDAVNLEADLIARYLLAQTQEQARI